MTDPCPQAPPNAAHRAPIRRNFVKTAGALSALHLATRWTGAQRLSVPAVKLYMTGATRKHELVAARAPAQTSATAETVAVDPSGRFQAMLGFGCAYTDASCYLLSTMQPDARQLPRGDLFAAADEPQRGPHYDRRQ